MTVFNVIIFLSMAVTVFGLPHPRLLSDQNEFGFTLVSRNEWNARPAESVTDLNTPVPYVIIHHSYEPGACHNTDECSNAMRWMQNYHQLHNGWVDIGYNFAVGSDGKAYEGRGWDRVGAHAVGYNSNGIGIVMIGDWRYTTPPAEQLETAKQLIAAGVKLGFIRPDYKLMGHRQVSATECPGDALFQEITTWDHFQTSA